MAKGGCKHMELISSQLEFENHEFEGCCGITIVHGFPEDSGINRECDLCGHDVPDKEVIEAIADALDLRGTPLHLAVLSDKQKLSQEALKREGFVPRIHFRGKSGNPLTLFVYGTHELVRKRA